jgi:hypothetical protein
LHGSKRNPVKNRNHDYVFRGVDTLASPLDRHDLQPSLLIVHREEDPPSADLGLPQALPDW